MSAGGKATRWSWCVGCHQCGDGRSPNVPTEPGDAPPGATDHALEEAIRRMRCAAS